jgi:hypothetical protein
VGNSTAIHSPIIWLCKLLDMPALRLPFHMMLPRLSNGNTHLLHMGFCWRRGQHQGKCPSQPGTDDGDHACSCSRWLRLDGSVAEVAFMVLWVRNGKMPNGKTALGWENAPRLQDANIDLFQQVPGRLRRKVLTPTTCAAVDTR